MQAVVPQPAAADAKDPFGKTSSNVQAAAALFPPTDFLNYGKEGESGLGVGILKDFRAAFDFHEIDPKLKAFVPVTDPEKLKQIAKDISPIYHVDAKDPPVLII